MILAGMLQRGHIYNDEGELYEVMNEPEILGGLVHMIVNPLGTEERKLMTYDPSAELLEA